MNTKVLLIALSVLTFINNASAANRCSSKPLSLKKLKSFFSEGKLKSKYFTTLTLTKSVKRCNEFSGCLPESSPRATMRFFETLSSVTNQQTSSLFPLKANAYFELTHEGAIKLRIYWEQLDIHADVRFQLGKKNISLSSNRYFRKARGHIHPVPYISYYNEPKIKPVELKGTLTENCLILKNNFTTELEGIRYDQFSVGLSGAF